MMTFEQIQEAVAFLREQAPAPSVTLLLGSGYSSLMSLIEGKVSIPYRDIPHFPRWHSDKNDATFIYGEWAGKKIMVMAKRFQYCYGYSSEDIAFPLRVLKLLGVEKLILTNAAGGINTSYDVGDFVAITDHIDFTGRNPLIGKNLDDLGPRFPDMSEIYTRSLIDLCLKTANETGILVKTGVYIGVTGPSYETPAEIRAFRKLGADLVGMSTVSEAIIARHMGQKVLGISTVTNQAAGNTPLLLAHEDVLKVSARRSEAMGVLLSRIISRM
jgi:purine-nucleoside phosphorylase